MNGKSIDEIFRDVNLPPKWIYCFNGHCPRCGECVHFITGKYVGDRLVYGLAVFPTAVRDGMPCRYFKLARVVTFAWGFRNLFNHVRHCDVAGIRLAMRDFLGNRTAYYRYGAGQYKLTPEQQQGIADIFRRRGYDGKIEFEHYADEPDLT